MPSYKHVRIRLVDGQVYEIEADVVAAHRARIVTAQSPRDTTFDNEYEHAIHDEDELRSWLLGNMDWWKLAPKKIQDRREIELKDIRIDDIEMFPWIGEPDEPEHIP